VYHKEKPALAPLSSSLVYLFLFFMMSDGRDRIARLLGTK
jgi:hypothetical protein